MKQESQQSIPNDYRSAFPYLIPDQGTHSEGICGFGLTKLEYFAGLAMQGMLANPELGRRSAHVIACEARQHSEYLLQELQTQGEK